MREEITATDPDVLKLVDTDFSVKRSIDAMARNRSFRDALEYLECLDEDELNAEDFEPLCFKECESIFTVQWYNEIVRSV